MKLKTKNTLIHIWVHLEQKCIKIQTQIIKHKNTNPELRRRKNWHFSFFFSLENKHIIKYTQTKKIKPTQKTNTTLSLSLSLSLSLYGEFVGVMGLWQLI